MIKEITILTFLLVCSTSSPTQPLQKVVAVVVQPKSVNPAETAEIIAPAESGWRNRGVYAGGYGYGQGSGWKHSAGGYRGGYFGGGWKRGGFYRVG